ncbi:MAG: Ku protein [Actinomycetota bacterium]|nr:Ku protein [Actinomycetota bacterium]
MAPRSIWNGTLAFGLVKVPIKLYSATESHTIRFRQVHAKDGSPLEHRRICTADDKEVEYDEIVKGYEVDEDEFIVLEPDEIKAAAGDRGKVVELEEFVDADDIYPVFFEKTYYAGFRDDAEPYALLQSALEKSGKAGIGRFSFHNREYLVAVRARAGVIAFHTLRFHDEVVLAKDLKVKPPKKKPSKKEVSMANKLIKDEREPFDPGKYKDEFRPEVEKLIEKKAKAGA